MKAPISCCLITRGESALAAAIASVRPWVEEVCVVYTGPDRLFDVPAQIDADVIEAFDWQDDFSAARNASFALATQPYILWLDSDDELIGADHLANLVSWLPTRNAWAYLPYDYEHDALGNVTCSLMRERIVTRGDFEWRYPVHECLVPTSSEKPSRVDTQLVRVKHRRTAADAVRSASRNVHILQQALIRDSKDLRSVFYLACALFDLREFDLAHPIFVQYLQSGGDDEQRAIACMRLATIAETRGDLGGSLAHAYAALAASQWSECYFAIARVHAAAAEQGGAGAKREWEKAVHFCRMGLSLPDTQTATTWVNPMDKAYYAREMLAVALAELGDFRGAVDAAHEALTARDDEDLRGQAKAWAARLPPPGPVLRVARGFAGFAKEDV